jgi:hypothetical protein
MDAENSYFYNVIWGREPTVADEYFISIQQAILRGAAGSGAAVATYLPRSDTGRTEQKV